MGGAAFTDSDFRNFDIVQVYDPARRDWIASTEHSASSISWPSALPWPSAGLGSCVFGGRVYVLGGHNGECIQNRAACYDLESGTWEVLPPMTEPRAAMGLAVMEGTLFAVGGRGADAKTPVRTMEALSI